MYHLPHICCTQLVPVISVCHKTLWVFQCIYVLTCVIYWSTDIKDDWSLELLVVCHTDYRRRQVGECADTWYKRIQPTDRDELLLPSNLPTRLCKSETTNGLIVLLFCGIHIDKGATLNLYSACVLFANNYSLEPYRPTVRRHQWHCWLLLLSQYNQLRLAPNIPWMHIVIIHYTTHSWLTSNWCYRNFNEVLGQDSHLLLNICLL